MTDVGPVPGTVRFWVTDSVGQRDSRLRPRLKADFDVTLAPVRDDGQLTAAPVRRRTLDVSAGGILVADHVARPGDLQLAILEVPGLPRPVQASARVVRLLPGAVAMRFEDLDPGVAETLDTLIFTVRQQVARRAFAAGPSSSRRAA
jgi:c-di-GMP-binding flagellar brake protein YcgR